MGSARFEERHVALYIFCSFIGVNSNQLIRNVLVGRSWEEKKRNRRVAEQVAGSFCYAGIDGSFCTIASDCLNLVSNIWERFHCVFCIGWFFVQGFKQVLFPVVVLIRSTMGCVCDKLPWFWLTKPLIGSLVTQTPKRYNVYICLQTHNFIFHYPLNTKESAVGLLLLRRKWFFPLMWEHFKGRNGAAETEKRRIGKETARNCDTKGQAQSWKSGWKRCWVLFPLSTFVSCVFVSSCLGFKWVALDLKKDMLLYIFLLLYCGQQQPTDSKCPGRKKWRRKDKKMKSCRTSCRKLLLCRPWNNALHHCFRLFKSGFK